MTVVGRVGYLANKQSRRRTSMEESFPPWVKSEFSRYKTPRSGAKMLLLTELSTGLR